MLMTCETAVADLRIPAATSNEGPTNIPGNLPFMEGEIEHVEAVVV